MRKRRMWQISALLLVYGFGWLMLNSELPDWLRIIAGCLMLVALVISLAVGLDIYNERTGRKEKR